MEREDPFDRIKREVKKMLGSEDRYRISIMKQVSTFGHY